MWAVMHPSKVVFAAASLYPPLTRAIMKIIGPHLPPHWVISQLAVRHRLRITVVGRLRNGMTITSVLGDAVGEIIRQHGCYEPVTVEAVLSHLTPDAVFYDVGAHIGQYSLLASERCREVHAFEAVPTTFEYLRRNIRQNRLANVTVNNLAVSDACGTVEIHESSADNLGSSSLVAPDRVSGHVYTVPAISLDEYVKTHPEPDLVKMDVEGAELLVLQGAGSLLKRRHPVLVAEVNEKTLARFGHTPEDMLVALRSFGYEIGSLDGFGFQNVLAVSAKRGANDDNPSA